ncbi:carbohydrate kinase family protein [Pelagicoccus sp. SDUM812002]|uniref:carbohydrate kinase family protein n=1 Tax=Pelagicoccus sp. SDUM812002 TaxID=3041266 RepID=UPI00280FDF22|nr:carbohydrate kinase family protein [Pelagicoccus sp. SDUM812002]MDQ8188278.1 carbohydrate kinase family protein [Pelagicoccus sp. SDUM812002]
MSSNIKKYIDFLNNIRGSVLLGCDGFVDEVYQIVDVRHSLTDYTPMENLKGFGELIVKRADGGVGLEIVPKRRCSGGFTPNTGRVAAFLGLKPTLTGLYGAKDIDPAFEEFVDNCELVSLGDPALTLVFEFSDGKLLMSALKTVANLTWDDFVAFFGEEKIKDLFEGVDILGLGYWSLTPDFDRFLTGFLSQYETAQAPRRMFFDFADIKKKSNESFLQSLELIKKFNQKIPMTLSLNEHEGEELFNRFGMEWISEPKQVAGGLTELRQRIGIDELVVHTPHFAAASSAIDGEDYALQELQTEVIRTAGAGDTFNGGYLCASLGDLPVKERLVIANAATAFFVTHATAPTKDELIAQIEDTSDK